jgi:hypothetical protein
MKIPLKILALPLLVHELCAQQISIPRIEQMPNMPAPYLMRDWKQVARGFDSLVFDVNRTGLYLPLTQIYSNTINYPGDQSFRFPAYVGAANSNNGEAIACLPAVVGATLVGIDKSNQNGVNWVRMCREWFNKKNAQNVYLNGPGSSSGDDWWYDMMPNIFFFQLYDRYPATVDFSGQLTTVADRWLAALKAMGASATPWSLANVNHRGWYLATMTPNDAPFREPEAAGAIAWLLYNAFVATGNQEYRVGAELAMESLIVYTTNPSYELQLPYGTFVAARMNAELGTAYDLTKLLNWCFASGDGTIRQWGVTVGNWGGYECSGLVGEINHSNDYPFLMNTFEQVGALVPLVRYDDRYARAIGKWVLNAANAARLFYPQYLPPGNQDSYQWASHYDSASCIGYESMRQYKLGGTASPYATGDAIGGGWASTNLGLYGSAHVGIFGGIVDTTNVPMILQLDLLKTEYFHKAAYPTFLYFNPYDIAKSVQIDVGAGQHDLYDAVSKSFLKTNVSGVASFTIPANAAVVIVTTPSGGAVTYDIDKTLISGIVVDYRSGRAINNYPPRIKGLVADSSAIVVTRSEKIYCTAVDRENDPLAYQWAAHLGGINGSGSIVTYTAPGSPGADTVTCVVSDAHGGYDTAQIRFNVFTSINSPPRIQQLIARPRKIDLRASSTLNCIATDSDSDSLAYLWTVAVGTLHGTGQTVTWTAPATGGNYYVRCTVDDGHGGQAVDSIGIEVRDFSKAQTGTLIAYYPFSGSGADSSGFNHGATVQGALLTSDRFGRPNSAYAFDGNAYLQVANDNALNFQSAISVSFWMKVATFFSREQYPVSHGNWQNRWKVSITPDKKVRWTVKTANGTKDLDSETILVADSLYLVTVTYNGADVELYLNSELDAFSSYSGLLQTTSIDLTIGRPLPGETNYSFVGVLDDIRIYDYALSVPSIRNLYDISTSVDDHPVAGVPASYRLYQNFPNPFNPATVIKFDIPREGLCTLKVFDITGREVAALINSDLKPGTYAVPWNAEKFSSGVYYYRLLSENNSDVRKMVLIR